MHRLSSAALVTLAMMAGGAGAARADETIRIIVPFAAGGPVDAVARLLANEMQAALGATVVVEDRGGAGGVIATEMVARAPADGKTLLMGSQGSHVISGLLQPDLKYDPAKSFTPIAMIGHVPMLLVAAPSLPANDFKAMLALAKTTKLSYGSAGPGTVMNIAGELINSGAGVQILHVPYRGVGPALPDLMAGRLDLLPADPPVLLPQVAAKTVKPLIVFGTERLASLPDIPTTVELGYPGMVMENWYGLLAPAGLPSDVAARLEKAALAAIRSPAMQAHMKNGELRGTLNAQEFRQRIASDLAYWRPTLVRLGISGEGTTPPANTK
ncbi:MAG TPA: tripartite tricarboxylate transporter substrate-binding protein [Xanthobacteraceae bacterium]